MIHPKLRQLYHLVEQHFGLLLLTLVKVCRCQVAHASQCFEMIDPEVLLVNLYHLRK